MTVGGALAGVLVGMGVFFEFCVNVFADHVSNG